MKAVASCRLGKHDTASAALEQSLGKARALGIHSSDYVTVAAEVAQAVGRSACAASLYATALALLDIQGAKRPLWEQAVVDHLIGHLRESLVKEAFDAAWEAGCVMTWEEAVSLALDPG